MQLRNAGFFLHQKHGRVTPTLAFRLVQLWYSNSVGIFTIASSVPLFTLVKWWRLLKSLVGLCDLFLVYWTESSFVDAIKKKKWCYQSTSFGKEIFWKVSRSHQVPIPEELRSSFKMPNNLSVKSEYVSNWIIHAFVESAARSAFDHRVFLRKFCDMGQSFIAISQVVLKL